MHLSTQFTVTQLLHTGYKKICLFRWVYQSLGIWGQEFLLCLCLLYSSLAIWGGRGLFISLCECGFTRALGVGGFSEAPWKPGPPLIRTQRACLVCSFTDLILANSRLPPQPYASASGSHVTNRWLLTALVMFVTCPTGLCQVNASKWHGSMCWPSSHRT